ncbi:5'-deoxynucleotidase hdd1-like isoform X2 [Coffea arabica]|uniref:5'-deoxynucleotidase n=1 Tax=Coffea arabica TaxID=13443 RepID=A0ABM4W3F6_COFAR
MAAVKGCQFSASLSGSCYVMRPRLHRFSVKIPFFDGPLRSRLVSLCCHNPNPDSFIVDLTVPLSKNPTHLPDDCPQASASSPSSAIDFLTLCHRLKTTKRKGWINHGIKGSESIADHMYRMALMALIASDLPGVNRERCIKIAIVHDIAEAEEIKELWEEYENNSSLEANLVKDFDKVEMILQALEYETEHGKVLDEFYLSTAGKIQTEIGKSWAAEIHARRNSRLKNKLN